MAEETVRIRVGEGRYTTADIVRRKGGCYFVRTFAFRAWQPSWLLAKFLVDGMMLPAVVISAAHQLVVVLKNSVRRGYDDMEGNTDGDYDGPMVFMGKKEKARHVLCSMQDEVSLVGR
jgi:hypothetical protein